MHSSSSLLSTSSASPTGASRNPSCARYSSPRARRADKRTQLRNHLEYLYLQVLSVVTLSQLQAIFAKRSNFDLRRLLEGAFSLLSLWPDLTGYCRNRTLLYEPRRDSPDLSPDPDFLSRSLPPRLLHTLPRRQSPRSPFHQSPSLSLLPPLTNLTKHRTSCTRSSSPPPAS